MPMQMHAGHIAAQAGGFEPQRTNHFSVRITGLEGADNLELSISGTAPPRRTIEVITIPYANENRKVASRVNYENWTLQVRDYVDKSIWGILWRWQELVHNSDTGVIGLASRYKKQGYLYLYSPDGTKRRTQELYGLFPISVSPGADFSMESAEQVVLAMELSVDKIKLVDF